MAGLISIELKQLRFYAYHGLYPEERKTGNEFEVNVSVSFQHNGPVISSLKDTVNYEKLYQLVKEVMVEPRDLLETLAMEMADKIHALFPGTQKIMVGVTKMHLPIEGFTGSAHVNYTKEF